MSIDALPTGFRQQNEKNTFSLYTCTYYSAYIYFLFVIESLLLQTTYKYDILKKVSHTFWVIKPYDAGG